jgi:hypothetical protein
MITEEKERKTHTMRLIGWMLITAREDASMQATKDETESRRGGRANTMQGDERKRGVSQLDQSFERKTELRRATTARFL